eukprot:13394210-Alexandrium_andersonii.AAC.1
MSASLVGSEMCIRDRLLGVTSKLGTESPWDSWMKFDTTGSRVSRLELGKSCLLYTSDAADDM